MRRASFISRITTGLQLAKQSLKVMRSEKRLLIFPLLSLISTVLILIVSGVIVFGGDPALLYHPSQTIQQSVGPAEYYIGLFLFYLVSYFVVIFFNSAMAASIVAYLKGEKPSVKSSLTVAWNHMGHIFAWSLVSATVGMIFHALENRSSFVERIVGMVIGVAWGIASYFVIPVLVIEDIGPMKAMKRSMHLIKKTWGESVVSSAGIGLLLLLFMALSALPFAVGVYSGSQDGLIAGLLVTLLLFIVFGLIGSTLTMILRCVLYMYASTGEIPRGFNQQLLKNTFRSK